MTLATFGSTAFAVTAVWLGCLLPWPERGPADGAIDISQPRVETFRHGGFAENLAENIGSNVEEQRLAWDAPASALLKCVPPTWDDWWQSLAHGREYDQPWWERWGCSASGALLAGTVLLDVALLACVWKSLREMCCRRKEVAVPDEERARMRRLAVTAALRDVKRRLGEAPRVCLLGREQPRTPRTEAMMDALAEQLKSSLGDDAWFIIHDPRGCSSTLTRCCSAKQRVVRLVAEDGSTDSGLGTDVVGMNVCVGNNDQERQEIFTRIGDVYLALEGGLGVAEEIRSALTRNAFVVPLPRLDGKHNATEDSIVDEFKRPPSISDDTWKTLFDSSACPKAVAAAAASAARSVLEERGVLAVVGWQDVADKLPEIHDHVSEVRSSHLTEQGKRDPLGPAVNGHISAIDRKQEVIGSPVAFDQLNIGRVDKHAGRGNPRTEPVVSKYPVSPVSQTRDAFGISPAPDSNPRIYTTPFEQASMLSPDVSHEGRSFLTPADMCLRHSPASHNESRVVATPLNQSIEIETGIVAKPSPYAVRISILSAEGLKHLNVVGVAPWCFCEVVRSTTVRNQPPPNFQTDIVPNTLNPVWNEVRDLPWRVGDGLSFTVYDKGLIGSKTNGRATLRSSDFYPDGFDAALPIVGVASGATLRVRVEVLKSVSDNLPARPAVVVTPALAEQPPVVSASVTHVDESTHRSGTSPPAAITDKISGPPWWVTYGVKPEGSNRDMGSWQATTFSAEQQRRFGVDADGEVVETAVFVHAVATLRTERLKHGANGNGSTAYSIASAARQREAAARSRARSAASTSPGPAAHRWTGDAASQRQPRTTSSRDASPAYRSLPLPAIGERNGTEGVPRQLGEPIAEPTYTRRLYQKPDGSRGWATPLEKERADEMRSDHSGFSPHSMRSQVSERSPFSPLVTEQPDNLRRATLGSSAGAASSGFRPANSGSSPVRSASLGATRPQASPTAVPSPLWHKYSMEGRTRALGGSASLGSLAEDRGARSSVTPTTGPSGSRRFAGRQLALASPALSGIEQYCISTPRSEPARSVSPGSELASWSPARASLDFMTSKTPQ
eukprot:TRINITY_DN21461_c0_g1_i1.p1 TRINITY_DN21461_c0_g1~~TRINITY_DN21461_c0_g1_i1.p1  ORF type:complete len:1070 (+),score=77.84 TRINITY_DN21461_c0_g1_i1:55-3264(+)